MKIDGNPVRVVPVEATGKMLGEAAKALSPDRRPCTEWMSVKRKHRTRYRAMLAVAPSAPDEVLVEMRDVLAIIEARIAPALLIQQTGDDDIYERIHAVLSRVEVSDA